MATNAPRTPTPWRDTFIQHIYSMPQQSFTLSTVHRSPSGTITPRARTCIYRGLWGSVPENDRNPAPRNPHVYDSDLPVLTTDVRMEKAGELALAGPEGSGGGGPVEAVWWAEKLGTQWRVKGTAWVLGPDIDGDSEGAKAARDALRARMWACGEEKEEGWSWEREVTAQFGNLSPGMRGTFRNPPPGRPRALPVEGVGLGLGQEVWDLQDPVARRNFRVVVIVPDEVEQVDLSDMKAPKRWLYVYRGASYKSTQPGGEVVGEWEKVELWP